MNLNVPEPIASAPEKIRLRLMIRGAVQGVGFRPFVYRLAVESGLTGWVSNSLQGVLIEVEGENAAATRFPLRIESEKPPRCFIQGMETSQMAPAGYSGFEIRSSQETGPLTALVLPDIATCPDCLREIFDPANRRHLYPFTNCTHCGPRFSIIESLPYDRSGTSMKAFTMCPECQSEYDNPLDRRFHAQPNACPSCGPRLELWTNEGKTEETDHAALLGAAEALRHGQIVAVKGLGGFHLMVAAQQEDAVQRLRDRKHREEKPFAVMFPSMERVADECQTNEFEERLLRSPEAPIILLRRKQSPTGESTARVSKGVAPGNPYLGVILPYTPLHHLLLRELGQPVVATSGNLSEEPICIDEQAAVNRLRGIADLFLVHNRPILRQVDDSIVRLMHGREMVLRRARGYAPLPITLKQSGPSIFAVGAGAKNSVALSVGKDVFVSQHIGDLETEAGYDAFCRIGCDLKALYKASPTLIAVDLHLDYLSTQFAQESGLPVASIQHHLAHALSCMAENEIEPPVLAVCWDGTGLGTDGTIWGGEFLRIGSQNWTRAGYFHPFRLPGGDKAAREPHRAALGLLFEVFGAPGFERTDISLLKTLPQGDLALFKRMLANSLNSPLTSSVGRLFDGVAALLGVSRANGFEGQSAMMLEFLAETHKTEEHYPFEIEPASEGAAKTIDWRPMLRRILADLASTRPPGFIAARFHNTLVEIILRMAQEFGEKFVVLTGGCFQNRYLTERTIQRLRDAGFRPCWHQRIPPNDGGIALGQVIGCQKGWFNRFKSGC